MEFLVIFFLIILNGVFSMSEIALVSAKKFKLDKAAKKGDINAKQALELANKPNTFLSTVQIGITLIGILTGLFSGKQLTANLTVWFAKLPILATYAESIATLSVVLIITYLTIVFGELIPKRLGLNAAEKIAAAVSRPMALLSVLAKPIIWLLSKTSDLFFRIWGIKEKTDGIITEEEIKEIVQESARGGEIRKIEEDIVKRVFALGDRKAGELMTHRRDVIWINISDSLSTIKDKVKQAPHSVYPVCDQTFDRLLGFLSINKLYGEQVDSEEAVKASIEISKGLKEPVFVSENMGAYRVLEHFKVNKFYAAAVVDEYGDIQGLITMHDVVDELVGNVNEEDQNDYQIYKRDQNSWLVDGQLPYFELIDYFHVAENQGPHSFTTVGGLFIDRVNHLPKIGEKINWNAYELEIVDMDGQRIDKLLVRKINKE